MKPDGTIERFDEMGRIREQALQSPDLGERGGHSTPEQALANLFPQALRDFQGYHQCVPNNPWRITLPFARYLDVGMEIICTERNKIWRVKRLHKRPNGNRSTVVELEGDDPPTADDKLRLSEEYEIDFFPAYPEHSIHTQVKEDGSTLSEVGQAFKDTITFQIIREEPGAAQGRPFSTPRDPKKRPRRVLQNPLDSRKMIQVSSQFLDSLVQFDCWAKSYPEAVSLKEWFQSFMDLYTGIMMWNGLTHIQYYDRARESVMTRWRSSLHFVGLVYYFRHEAQQYHALNRLLEATFDLRLVADDESSTQPIPEFPDPTGQPTGTVTQL